MRNLPSNPLPQHGYVPGTLADSPSPIHLDIPADPYAKEEEPRFVEYWRLVRTGWKWVIGGALGAFAAALAYILIATPLYTAEAKIMIERRAQNALNIQELLADGMTGDESNYYRTQEQILRSRTLAVDVISQLGLERNPLFTEPQGELGLVSGWVASAKALVSGSPKQRTDPSGLDPTVIRQYQDDLSVSPVTRTKLAVVRFTTPDPDLSAEIANAHVSAYIGQGLRLRSEANDEARVFLHEKLTEIKEKLQSSEAALNAYRRDKGIISLDDKENIVVDRLADLNDLLTGAEAQRINLEADVKLIKSRAYDSLPAVTSNTLIQALKSQLAEREGEYVELAAQFKHAYPPVQQAKAEVDALRARLDKEVGQVVGTIESEYLAAVDHEEQLRKAMDDQKKRALSMKDAAVDYAILEREVETNEQLYDDILQRMKEIGVVAAVQTSNVSIIDRATPPEYPSSPRKLRALLLAMLVGSGLGVGFVLGRDFIDQSVKNADEVERHLQLPSLGVVPDFEALPSDAAMYGYGSGSRSKSKPLQIEEVAPAENPQMKAADAFGVSPDARRADPTAIEVGAGQMKLVGSVPKADSSLVLSQGNESVVTEAYRTLRTAILFSTPEQAPQTMMFTSALESEGKTTTSLNTAIVFARLGSRVLIIDADMRRASCHRRFGVGNDYGLSEVLTGQKGLHEAIKKSSVDGVYMLPAGSLPPNPTELVGSKAMQDLLAECSETFDYVIVDSPPVMAVNDAVVIAHMVDGVVMVVRAHHTPRKILQRAESRLLQARAHMLGVLLNKVDSRTDHYATYYGGKYYSSYYASADTRAGEDRPSA